MKKLIFTLVLAAVAGAASAQFNQGRMLVGGDFSFSSQTEKSKSGGTTVTFGKTTSIELGPKVGYFLIDNLAVGAALDVSLTKFKPEDADNDSENTFTTFGIAPFVRYYLSQGIFFQGQFGVGSGKNKSTLGSVSNESKFGVTNLNVGAGYAYFLNDNVAIEPMIGYGSTTLNYKDSNPEFKDLRSGLFLQVSIQAYLGSK